MAARKKKPGKKTPPVRGIINPNFESQIDINTGEPKNPGAKPKSRKKQGRKRR